MSRRIVARTAAAHAALPPLLAVPIPALAAAPGWQGTGLTLLQYLGIFVGIPVGLFLVISLCVWLPALLDRQRRRRSSPG